jgi:hypothetical protein
MAHVMMSDATSLIPWRRRKPRGRVAEGEDEDEDKAGESSWDCEVTARFV